MKSVLLSFLLLSAAYVLVVELWDPQFRVADDQEARNIVRAEQLRLRTELPHTIVVGSSLINGMQEFADEDSLFFLPQGGGSAREGLSFLVDQGLFPARLIVETNALPVSYREDFISQFRGPIRGILPQYLKAFRYQNRPMNVFLSQLYRFYRPDGRPERLEAPAGGEALRIRVEGFLETYQKPPIEPRYQSNLQATAGLLDQLRASGVEILLVELPVYPDFIDTTYHMTRRNQLFHVLGEAGIWYDWSSLENAGFTDAIHFAGGTLKCVVNKMQSVHIDQK